jgi:hypothetical protein
MTATLIKPGCDELGDIKADETSLDLIVANIDDAGGRNDALRKYIFALRDWQCTCNRGCYEIVTDAETNSVKQALIDAFDRLTDAEITLNNRW